MCIYTCIYVCIYVHMCVYIHIFESESWLKGGECCGHPGRQTPRGGNEYFKWNKKLIFCSQQILKLLRKMKENSISNCDSFKFLISVRSCHRDCTPGATKNLAASLIWIKHFCGYSGFWTPVHTRCIGLDPFFCSHALPDEGREHLYT